MLKTVVVKAVPKCPKCGRELESYDLEFGYGRCKVCGLPVDLKANIKPRAKGGVEKDAQVAVA